jgi:DNA repair exonuclease SbcCD nuclease subunit
MIKFLHTADLHLKAPSNEDSDFSLECLKILIGRANKEEVDAVLLCGDIFDKESDYSDKAFCQKAISIFNQANMSLYYIPGNHEDHTGKFAKFKTIDWGDKVKPIPEVSLETFTKGDEVVEIIGLPHSLNYEDFADWNLPKKKTKHRIAMAHGEIPGFTFLGDEEGAGVLSPSLFAHHEVSYVFMGHIHRVDELTNLGIRFYYAGSPRPVRRREDGVRGFNIIEISESITVKREDIVEVGLVHNLTMAVLGQDWIQDIEKACASFNEIDRVNIVLEGMVEDGNEIDQEIEKLTKQLKAKYRRVNIKKELDPLEDLIKNEFYKNVYELWLEKKPDARETRDFQVWIQMLNSIKFMKEQVLK